jgi:hypothetical protein
VLRAMAGCISLLFTNSACMAALLLLSLALSGGATPPRA